MQLRQIVPEAGFLSPKDIQSSSRRERAHTLSRGLHEHPPMQVSFVGRAPATERTATKRAGILILSCSPKDMDHTFFYSSQKEGVGGGQFPAPSQCSFAIPLGFESVLDSHVTCASLF